MRFMPHMLIFLTPKAFDNYRILLFWPSFLMRIWSLIQKIFARLATIRMRVRFGTESGVKNRSKDVHQDFFSDKDAIYRVKGELLGRRARWKQLNLNMDSQMHLFALDVLDLLDAGYPINIIQRSWRATLGDVKWRAIGLKVFHLFSKCAIKHRTIHAEIGQLSEDICLKLRRVFNSAAHQRGHPYWQHLSRNAELDGQRFIWALERWLWPWQRRW